MLQTHFVGQTPAITQLQTAIDASKSRGTILPHTLLIAPPGVGKTRLAEQIAMEAGAPYASIALPADIKTLASLMLSHRGVLLLDEVHQADRKTLDTLLPFLVDGTIKWRRVTEHNRQLTIVAATTDPQKLPDAFTSRFRLRPSFCEYTPEEITEIILSTAAIKHHIFSFPQEMAEGLAGASLNNPRQALGLLDAYLDLRELQDQVTVTDVLTHTGITEQGLRTEHIQYLRSLRKQGGVASQATLAQMVFMPDAAMRQIERDLLRLGIIVISTLGRELLDRDSWEPGRDEPGFEQVDVESLEDDTYINPYTGEVEPR